MFPNQTAQAWAARLDRFDQADTTLAQFCLLEGVSQASYSVHPTEACADPRIEVFQGMAPVSHDWMKNRPR